MKNKNLQAFTLVELIVVITILAILGTIAFISLQSYTRNARDGQRISDINNIRKNLELFYTEKGIYPLPDNGIQMTYSGSLAWTQGTVGDNTIKNLQKLNKKPTDPLTGNEYTYSITNLKTEYQLGAIQEGGTILSLIPQTQAATLKTISALVVGTYNEKMLKVQSGTTDYILALPSIINADITDVDVQTIINKKNLVYNNYTNLPDSYKNLGYTMTGGFDYAPTANIVVYSGSIQNLNQDTNKIELINNLKQVYYNTILENQTTYKDIVNSDTTTNEAEAIQLTNSYINNYIGKGIVPIDVISNNFCTKSIKSVYENITVNGGYNGVLLQNGKIFFNASISGFGNEIWLNDGTNSGTYLLKDISNGGSSGNPIQLNSYNDEVYFVAYNSTNGLEVWKTNGTASGTNLLKDINPGSANSLSNFGMTFFKNFNGNMYFNANNGTSGEELWKTDGTTLGTTLIKDIRPGASGSIPSFTFVYNGDLYFQANDGTNGQELWKSNGTSVGTTMVKNINPGLSNGFSSFPRFNTYNGEFYFTANDGTNGQELWKSNGTSVGTTMVKDIYPGSTGGSLYGSKVYNNELFFVSSGLEGRELWKTDGTTLGTTLVKDINPGSGHGFTSSEVIFIEYNGELYFIANDGVNGDELWKTNGTNAGTILVKDINPGITSGLINPAGSFPVSPFIIFDGELYFSANDGTKGQELWKTNGTNAGTILVSDINIGVSSSNPSNFNILNSELFFSISGGIKKYGCY